MKPFDPDEVNQQINAINQGVKFALPEIEGYSSWKVRNLLNRFILLRPRGINYLEIGVHLGSTFIPAMNRQPYARATAIDAWNMFGDLEDRFRANVHQYLDKRHIKIIHGDFRTVDLTEIYQPVNIYFYDGDHSMECQYDALVAIQSVLADQFIFLVDDFNWQEPRDGTRKAIADLNLTVEAEWVLPGPYNGGESEWWNGLFVGIIHK